MIHKRAPEESTRFLDERDGVNKQEQPKKQKKGPLKPNTKEATSTHMDTGTLADLSPEAAAALAAFLAEQQEKEMLEVAADDCK